MLFETQDNLIDAEIPSTPVGGALPAGLVLCERAAGALRSYLQERGLSGWRIFHCAPGELYDIDDHIGPLGEDTGWEAPPNSVNGGEALSALTVDDDDVRTWPCGFLNLRRSQVVLARWYWPGDGPSSLQSLWLCAVPAAGQFLRLRQRVAQLRREKAAAVWQIVTGNDWAGGARLARQVEDGRQLVLSPAIRQRVEADIVGFFGESVASLYRTLGVPYRRGVLLYGPPGNGKTSLIRHVGCMLPKVPVLVCRPCSTFDSDDLQVIVDRWVQQAPAILVIEDLDWLLSLVNVSRFLNMIDGVESRTTGGLLLIATTNHPGELDPAINNRPGRFDVAIEMPCPDATTRLEYLRARLSSVDSETLRQTADLTDGLSFSHLQEIVKLSGLLAIHAGNDRRSDNHVLSAARQVVESHEAAVRGYPARPEVPFGLKPRRLQSLTRGNAGG